MHSQQNKKVSTVLKTKHEKRECSKITNAALNCLPPKNFPVLIDSLKMMVLKFGVGDFVMIFYSKIFSLVNIFIKFDNFVFFLDSIIFFKREIFLI